MLRRCTRLIASMFVAGLTGACGSRTGLLVPLPASDAGEPGIGDATTGLDAPFLSTDAGEGDAGEDAPALPPIDASPPPVINECPDAGATLVYVITKDGTLMSFYPPTSSFNVIGPITCPLAFLPQPTQPKPSPFSMAVDRTGIAYTVFSDGELFRVSTAPTAPCESTPFVIGQQGFSPTFGMGFSSDGADAGETLFVAGAAGSAGVDRVRNVCAARSGRLRPARDFARADRHGCGRSLRLLFSGTGARLRHRPSRQSHGADRRPIGLAERRTRRRMGVRVLGRRLQLFTGPTPFTSAVVTKLPSCVTVRLSKSPNRTASSWGRGCRRAHRSGEFMRPALVSFVALGPGDAALRTELASRRLSEADAVVEANAEPERLIALARAGKRVVCSVEGEVTESVGAMALARAVSLDGVAIEIVPGVGANASAAAFAGVLGRALRVRSGDELVRSVEGLEKSLPITLIAHPGSASQRVVVTTAGEAASLSWMLGEKDLIVAWGTPTRPCAGTSDARFSASAF